MRLLFPLLLFAAVPGCTRENPVFGEGETEPSDSGKDTGNDPTGNPTSDSVSSSAETGTASQSTTQSDSGPDSTISSADTIGPPGEDCCMRHDTPGCEDSNVERCVCSELPSCCAELWGDKCVEKARHCGADCPIATTGIASESLTDTVSGGTTTDGGSSTTANDGGGSSSTGGAADCCVMADAFGCPGNPTIEACVCNEHPECCSGAWNETCVAYAVECGLAC